MIKNNKLFKRKKNDMKNLIKHVSSRNYLVIANFNI